MLVIWDFKAHWGGGGGDLRLKVYMGRGIPSGLHQGKTWVGMMTGVNNPIGDPRDLPRGGVNS